MTLDEWIDAACRELGLDAVVDRATVTDLTLDLARDVAHAVERRAAPITTFLVGLAAGREGGDLHAAALAVRALLQADQEGVAEGSD